MKTQNIAVIIIIILLTIAVSSPNLVFAQNNEEPELQELVETTQEVAPVLNSPTAMPTATHVPTVEVPEPNENKAAILPEQTPELIQQLVVSSSEPSQAAVGVKANISIFGGSFTEQTTVRLVGFGLLDVDYINPNALFVEVPATIPVGIYDVEVSDPQGGTQLSPDRLTIMAQATSTKMPPTPAPTSPPATPVPGEPSLSVISYMPIPGTAIQGQDIAFNVTLVNRGNRVAMSPTAAFSSGGSIIPSHNKTYVTLPNIGPNASHTFSITGRVAPSASRGLNSVTVNISYSDFENNSYSATGALTIEVENKLKISELTLKNVVVNPDPIQRGEPVILRLLLANTGTQNISRLRLNLPPTGPIVIPGGEGTSYELANIPAGGELAVTLNVIAAETLSEGLQAQPFQLSYVQDGEHKTTEMQAIIPVAPSPAAMPATILMESFDYGSQTITPGERFVFTAKIVNLSAEPIENALITFTNQIHPNGGYSFFLYESAGTQLLDEIPAEGIIVSQEFLSSGALQAGIAPLQFSIKYNGGTTDTFTASVLVNAPPRLSFSSNTTIPVSVVIGETLDLSLSLYNGSSMNVIFNSAKISGENFEREGEEDLPFQSVYSGASQPINASFTASEIGDGKIVLDFIYLDFFGQEQSLTKEYRIKVVTDATPTPTATATPEATEAVEDDSDDEFSEKSDKDDGDDKDASLSDKLIEIEEHELPEDFWERTVLSFLGLGF